MNFCFVLTFQAVKVGPRCLWFYPHTCFQPQSILWERKYHIFKDKKSDIISLPGAMETVKVKASSGSKAVLQLRWIHHVLSDPYDHLNQIARVDDEEIEGCRSFYEPGVTYKYVPKEAIVFTSCNRYYKTEKISKGKYFFHKCLNNKHNYKFSIHNEQQYFPKNKNGTYCQNYIHRPHLYSWIDAQMECSEMNRTLPEFISRGDEDEFLRLIKMSVTLLPMEGVFIGLLQKVKKQVRFGCW